VGTVLGVNLLLMSLFLSREFGFFFGFLFVLGFFGPYLVSVLQSASCFFFHPSQKNVLGIESKPERRYNEDEPRKKSNKTKGVFFKISLSPF